MEGVYRMLPIKWTALISLTLIMNRRLENHPKGGYSARNDKDSTDDDGFLDDEVAAVAAANSDDDNDNDNDDADDDGNE